MSRHRTVLPIVSAVLFALPVAAQEAPPPPPPTPPGDVPTSPAAAAAAAEAAEAKPEAEETKPAVQVALERVAGEPKDVFHETDGPVWKEWLRMQWPDLTVERIRVRRSRMALFQVRAVRRATLTKGPRFWGATVLIEQRGTTIVRLRGSRLKVNAAQTRRIREALWTGIAPEPHAASQRHVFVSNPSGSRYYTSSERRKPRRAGRFQTRLKHTLFARFYVKLARANHDALVEAPNSVTSLHEQGERTLVTRRTLYPEFSIERKRIAPESALTKLQVLEDGLDLPLLRTPSQVRKNEPPGRVSPGLDDQVAPAKE